MTFDAAKGRFLTPSMHKTFHTLAEDAARLAVGCASSC